MNKQLQNKILRDRILRVRRWGKPPEVPMTKKEQNAVATLDAYDKRREVIEQAHHMKRQTALQQLEDAVLRGDTERVIEMLWILEI